MRLFAAGLVLGGLLAALLLRPPAPLPPPPARVDTLRVTLARLDTVYARDTVVLWRTVRAVDTVIRVDSVPVIARDSARADSALRLSLAGLRACLGTVRLCEQRLAVQESLPVAAPRPPARGRVFVAGVLAGLVLPRLLRR